MAALTIRPFDAVRPRGHEKSLKEDSTRGASRSLQFDLACEDRAVNIAGDDNIVCDNVPFNASSRPYLDLGATNIAADLAADFNNAVCHQSAGQGNAFRNNGRPFSP